MLVVDCHQEQHCGERMDHASIGWRSRRTALAGNRAWAEAGDSGEAAPVGAGPRNGRPALASSSKESTCRQIKPPDMGYAHNTGPSMKARQCNWQNPCDRNTARTSCCESLLESHCRNRLSSFSFEHGNRLFVESRPKENMLPAKPPPALPAPVATSRLSVTVNGAQADDQSVSHKDGLCQTGGREG